VVEPIQINDAPVIVVAGFESTVIGSVAFETHPVVLSVKVNVAEPIDNPVTSPELFTLATDGLLLDHVPPDEGVSCEVDPMQIALEPAILTIGLGLTSITASKTVEQPRSFVTVTKYWEDGNEGVTVTC
jgi:hypothetical protein